MNEDARPTCSRLSLAELRHRIESANDFTDYRLLDVELFQLASDLPAHLTADNETTSWRNGSTLTGAHWVIEPEGESLSWSAEGWVPGVSRSLIPFYLSESDDSISLLHELGTNGRLLSLNELEDDWLPKWRATLTVGQVPVASGESYKISVAIVLALLGDLIANKDASYRIEVVD